MRAIFGIDRLDAGSIEVDGRPVRIRGPRDALDAGIALVPEDRARAGLVREHSVGQNALMAAWRQFARAASWTTAAARRAAIGFVERLNIRTTGIDQPVKELSGGNQQKVVVAKNLSVRAVGAAARRPHRGCRCRLQARDPDAGAGPRGRRRRHPAGVIRVRGAQRGRRPGAGHRGTAPSCASSTAPPGDDLSEEALSRAVQEEEVRPGTSDAPPPKPIAIQTQEAIAQDDQPHGCTSTRPAPGALAPHGLPARRDAHLRGRPVASTPAPTASTGVTSSPRTAWPSAR